MKVFHQVFRFYINSSIHVALAVLSLGMVTGITMDMPLDKTLVAVLFFGTITGYNFVKYAGVAGLHHLSLTPGLKIIQVFSFFCAIALGVALVNLPKDVLIYGSVFGLCTGLYALPLFSRKRNLRSVRGVKIFVIALVWTGVAVVLPVINSGELLTWDVYVMIVQRFLFVIVITIPFEVRDLKYDAISLGTLPQLFGIKRVKYLGLFLLSCVFLFEFAKDIVDAAQLLSTFGIVCLTGVALLNAKEKQSQYFASFWVESLPILWLCLLCGGQLLLT
jgi:hypothetical protein